MSDAFTPSQMGSCANKGLVCHRSSETGGLWCPRLREWRGSCPKEDAEERISEEWYGEEDGK